MNHNLITRIEELQELDRRISDICAGLPIVPGSLSRLHHEFYPSYGIHLPEELEDELEAYSLKEFEGEWTETDIEMNRCIERAIKNANIASGNIDLNGLVGRLFREVLTRLYDSKKMISVTDFGAGGGDTTEAILDALGEDPENGPKIAEKCYFKLVEPSYSRLDEAKEKLDRNPISSDVYHGKTRPRFILKNYTMHEYLAGDAKKGDVDVIVSSAMMHHMSYPNYLRELYELLSDDGVMIIGDWHNNLLRHPANLASIIREIHPDKYAAEAFEMLFNIKADDASGIERRLPKEDKKANDDFKRFAIAQGHEMRMLGDCPKVSFLEALNTMDVFVRELENAGFETDIKQLCKNHKGFAGMERNIRRMLPDRNVAFVIAVAKRPLGKTG